PSRLRRGRRADPARALADQPEVDLRHGQGRGRLPDHELPRRLRPARRRHAHVQQLRAAPEPPLRDRHDRHAGARARDRRARQPRAAARLLLLHRRGARPPHRRGARNAGRRVRLRPGREHLDGRLGGAHPARGRGARLLAGRPGDRLDAAALPPGRERRARAPRRPREADARDRLDPQGLLGGGHPAHDSLVRRQPRALARARRLAADRAAGRDGPMTRVLVTGGGGFLGSHLVERLERDGHDVVAARRRDYDLTSLEDARRLFDDAEPELVFHLAAEVGGIGANRANPGRYWYANVVMGAHVLEQARLHETPKVVVAGTVCAYPKHTPVPFREEDLWNGYPEETNAPYGVAKKAILVGAQAYREQYGLNTIFLLPTNLYGPRDNFYVEDAADALVLAAERYDGADPVNVGTGVETSIRETAELIADVLDWRGEIEWDTSKPNGQPRRCLDASKAERLFGFRARVGLREGIERTVAWYLAEQGAPAR